MKQIKFYDLTIQNSCILEGVQQRWRDLISENTFIQGNAVTSFEKRYSDFARIRNTIGVANGTDAIELLLRASDIPKDSTILIPAHTFIATALAVLRAGYKVELVDVAEGNMLVDPVTVAEKISKQTKGFVAVHLYGQLVDMKEIASLMRDRVFLFEDGAQSQGASLNGDYAGTYSSGVATSFYPGKNLGAFGDAGAVSTNDDAIAEKVRSLGNYGSLKKYFHPEIGFNSRLDTLQAVVLDEKLKHLNKWNSERQNLARNYLEKLNGVEQIRLPQVSEVDGHVWHLFVIRVPERDEVVQRMQNLGVQCIIHYPRAIHLQGGLAELGYKVGDFPVAESIADSCLSLPLYPGMTESDQDYVVDCLKAAVGDK
jgi:dTDP-4-amino-4,6-dideoxygalactose transaminase